MNDFDDQPGTFTHKRVSAATAPPVRTTGARSVFDVAAPAPTALKRVRRYRSTPEAHLDLIVERLDELGEIDRSGVMQLLGCVSSVACRAIKKLLEQSRIVLVRTGHNSRKFYALPVVGPKLKTVLAPVKGAPAIGGRRSTGASNARSTSAASALRLSCALFNTGDLLIECGTQSMRLDKSSVRALVAYLDRISAALQAG